LILCSLVGLAQKCEILEGKEMNCIDKDSLRQGFWFEYSVQKILTTDSFMRNPRAFGPHNRSGEVFTPLAEGFYKDNKRVGGWTYYVGFYNDKDAHLKTVIFTDSGYRYEIDSFYHYNFKISDDTSSLTGKLYLKNDTVDVLCKGGKCKMYNPFRKRKEKFRQRDLDTKIQAFNFYSYKVKSKKPKD
jgi:hypothetical protein